MVTDLSELEQCDDVDDLLESLHRWSLPRGSIGFGADLGDDFARRMVEAIKLKVAALGPDQTSLQ